MSTPVVAPPAACPVCLGGRLVRRTARGTGSGPMSTDTRCIHDLLIGQCAHCRPDIAADDPTPAARWFVAAFPGRCSGCGMRQEVGELICADGEGGYLGLCCGEPT